MASIFDKINEYRIILDNADNAIYSVKQLLKSKEAKDLSSKLKEVMNDINIILENAEPPKKVK